MGNSNSSLLKPCPFCGGEAEMDTRRAYRNISTGQLGDAVAIYCLGCSADMNACRADHSGLSNEDLICMVSELWNRRPLSEAAPVDAVEEQGSTRSGEEHPSDSSRIAMEEALAKIHALATGALGHGGPHNFSSLCDAYQEVLDDIATAALSPSSSKKD